MTSPDGWTGGHNPGWDDMGDMAREFGEFLSGPLSKIAQNIFKSISQIFGKGDRGLEGVQDWVDGQELYNERTDQLSPLLDYGSAYMDTSGGFANAGQAWFVHQVGPMKKCHIANGRIVLEEAGLWDIRASLWFDYINVLGGGVGWEVREIGRASCRERVL